MEPFRVAPSAERIRGPPIGGDKLSQDRLIPWECSEALAQK